MTRDIDRSIVVNVDLWIVATYRLTKGLNIWTIYIYILYMSCHYASEHGWRCKHVWILYICWSDDYYAVWFKDQGFATKLLILPQICSHELGQKTWPLLAFKDVTFPFPPFWFKNWLTNWGNEWHKKWMDCSWPQFPQVKIEDTKCWNM